MYNPFDFTDKKIIIAGATSGIGKATAVALANQGAKLSLVGRDEDKLNAVISILCGGGVWSFLQYYGF